MAQASLGFPVEERRRRMISQRAWIAQAGDSRTVIVNYVPVASYPVQDRPTERYLIGCLAQAGVGTKVELARAFGCHRNHVAHLAQVVQRHGVAGVLDARQGNRRPPKLTAAIRRRIAALADQGQPNRVIATQIAAEFGVALSVPTIKKAKREARGAAAPASAPEPPAAQLPLPEPAPLPVSPAEPLAEPPLAAAPAPEAAEGPDPLAAPVVFRAAARVSYAGGFFFYAAFAALGVLPVFTEVYQWVRGVLYGLPQTILAFLFLLVEEGGTLEAAKGLLRADFAALLGLPSAPCVKTLRRKLAVLAQAKQAAQLLIALAKRWVEAEAVEVGVLYVDGHFKPYYGSRPISKGWFTQRRLAHPGCLEYFVGDRRGRPLFFLLTEAHTSLIQAMPQILADLRAILGARPFTLVFDRGGFSAPLFRFLDGEGVGWITYRRGFRQRWAATRFRRRAVKLAGVWHRYVLAEGQTRLAGYGLVRTLVVRKNGHDTPIITSDATRPAPLIATLMFARWGQENFFKYMKQHYLLDALVTYEAGPAADREIPNPEKKVLTRKIQALRQAITALRDRLGAAVLAGPNRGRTVRGLQAKHRAEVQTLRRQEAQLAKLLAARRALPARVRLSEAGPAGAQEALRLEKKAILDALKCCAYQAEEWLLTRLRPHYENLHDVRALLRILSQAKGALAVEGDTLTVELEPLSPPQFHRAAAGLCAELNALDITLPHANLKLRYRMADPVHTTGIPDAA